jgi:tetratricopeptide (TPR) repeat protein
MPDQHLCASTHKPSVADTTHRNAALIIVGLLLCCVVVFGQMAAFEFLMWDDEPFVLRHLQRARGLSANSIVWSFTNSENGWRTPIPYLLFFAEAEIYGLNPAGYHLTGLAIHAASTILLFITFRRMTGHLWASGMLAAMFAIHPLHVEPVAWIAARWDLLCGFFWILGMYFYAAYCRRPGAAKYCAVLACYICAIMSKPMALTFPFALLLLDYWPLRRAFGSLDHKFADGAQSSKPTPISLRFILLEKVPLFTVMAIAMAITIPAKSAYFATRQMIPISTLDRMLNCVESYANYVYQLVWPTDLSFYYPHPAVTDGFSTVSLMCATTALLGITVTILFLGRRHRYLVTGWFWFLGILVPAIGLFQTEHHARADRYMYLPLIGLGLVVCWGFQSLTNRTPKQSFIVAVTSIALITALISLARVQTSYWKDNSALFEHALSVDADNHKALVGMGTVAMRDRDFELAETYYRRTLPAIPGRGYHHYLLGKSLFFQDRFGAAERHLRVAIDETPGLTKAWRLLALTLREQHNVEGALGVCRRMVQVRPNDPLAHQWLGDYLFDQEEFDEALLHYRHALRLDPLSQTATARIAKTLNRLGRGQEAVKFLESYLQTYPRRDDIADQLAWLLATHPDPLVRNSQKAALIAERLSQSSGHRNRFALDTLAAAYAADGNFRKASETAIKALHLAKSSNDKQHATVIQSRLTLYQNRQPFRQEQTVNTGATTSTQQRDKSDQTPKHG